MQAECSKLDEDSLRTRVNGGVVVSQEVRKDRRVVLGDEFPLILGIWSANVALSPSAGRAKGKMSLHDRRG